ncbi:uncharacterized protein VICG_01145 [Vittaforma corneae ATCC 50505]|uniref:Trafficking protein particle complex subunit n=1 Tax=Vittaforma corneae (strain ATCC 50505) TaxID=993615 RepID=L2GLM7_VITCO|nr:uncharacterized protein VICG_01145 [Vittaforma corneae ATCC 50505]ELA41793.1 hypothetical protein VICG_01145 [Vittaforma corneae ATCC 50505]
MVISFAQKNLVITNKSGGLIYSSLTDADPNEMLIIGSTLHTLLEILEHICEGQSLSNAQAYNKTVEYGQSKIITFRTLTGYSFIFLWDSTDPPFNSVYLHFCETVLQNYSYRLGMPARSKRFCPEQYF